MSKKVKVDEYIDKVSGITLYRKQDIYTNRRTVISYFKDPDLKIVHREDGPASEVVNDYQLWMGNNKPHRIDGPAYFGDFYGGKYNLIHWYIDGTLIFSTDATGKVIARLT